MIASTIEYFRANPGFTAVAIHAAHLGYGKIKEIYPFAISQGGIVRVILRFIWIPEDKPAPAAK